ncbi:MAG: hypothetical protein V3U92_15985 [Cellulophaga sp.]
MKIKTSDSYQKEVLKEYKKDKGGEMNTYLAQPTPKLIKNACKWLFYKRNLKHDSYILNHFFQFKNVENGLREIENCGTAKFKPIVNFLKGKSQNTSIENLELISWLIDFQPRPLQEYLKLGDSFSEKILPQNETEYTPDGNEMISGKKINNDLEKRRNRKHKWSLVVSICIVFVTVLMAVPGLKNRIFNNPITIVGNNNCMTWDKTHFKKVSCITTFGAKIVPLDQVRLKTFKKVEVTMATLFFSEETNKPLFWYYKTKKGEIEFFTAPGLHPITEKTLDEITPYIIQKYVPLHSNNRNSFVK